MRVVFTTHIILMLSFLLFSGLPLDLPAQSPKKPHSASKAALYSAVVPGLGQAYNQKYWKIPLVYAGFGTLYYFIQSNHAEYLKFKNAYDFKTGSATDPSKYNEYVDKYTESGLLDGRNYYRRNRDFSIILSSVWYLLNITDAAVDAYLFDYDIGGDLSLHVQPAFPGSIPGQSITGLSVTMRFK